MLSVIYFVIDGKELNPNVAEFSDGPMKKKRKENLHIQWYWTYENELWINKNKNKYAFYVV